MSAVIRVLFASLAVMLASVVVIAAVIVIGTTSQIKPGTQLLQANGKVAPLPQVGPLEGGASILLTGTDTRTGQGGAFNSKDQLDGSSGVGSNDVTMVLHIAADHRSATVISIPRDLMAPVPECPDPSGGTFSARSKAMFNTTLSEGGLSCVVLAAQALTGLDIKYAALINFDGVIAMSDAIGGVTVCLDAAINDPSAALDLPAGTQSIKGDVALAFVRTRAGVGDGSDLGRISNQQVFLSAMVRQVLHGGVLSNPIAVYQLADAAVKNLQTSASLSNPTSMMSLALAMKNIDTGNIVFIQYPVFADPENPNRVVPNSGAVDALKAALAADQPLQLTGKLGVGAEADPSPAAPAPTQTPSAIDVLRIPVPTPSETVSASPVAEPIPLPSGITGQTAAQSTCSKANN
jgi:LCP family protein required for cell wall assembly